MGQNRYHPPPVRGSSRESRFQIVSVFFGCDEDLHHHANTVSFKLRFLTGQMQRSNFAVLSRDRSSLKARQFWASGRAKIIFFSSFVLSDLHPSVRFPE
jgi:hypothetical protein